jgi:hypothetical protein
VQSWSEHITTPDPHDHLVQFYGSDDGLLVRNIAAFCGAALEAGEGVLVIARAAHADALLRQLRDGGHDVPAALGFGRLRLIDAGQALESLLKDGAPDWELFQAAIAGPLADVRRASGTGKARAFGEMVGILWDRGARESALRLEEYWHRLLAGAEVPLFCAYPVDIAGDGDGRPGLDPVIAAHTHTCAGPRTLISNAS